MQANRHKQSLLVNHVVLKKGRKREKYIKWAKIVKNLTNNVLLFPELISHVIRHVIENTNKNRLTLLIKFLLFTLRIELDHVVR